MAAKKRKRPETRAESMQETRAALVDAALELFATDGLDASLDAICERAGYTRGALYVHFADRDALLVAAMEKMGATFLARMFATDTAEEAAPTEPHHTPRAESRAAGHAKAAAADARAAGHAKAAAADARAASHAGGGDRFAARHAIAHDGEGGALAGAAARFIKAVTSGDYPLMAPGRAQIQFHQLLDACARSATVRAQYRGLVQASIDHVTTLAAYDQVAGAVRDDLVPSQLATAMLATIIGAQTMAELGVPVDAAALSATLLAAIRR